MIVLLLLSPIWLNITILLIAAIFRLDGKLLDIESDNKGEPTIPVRDIIDMHLKEKHSDCHLLKW
jgi:hypothetical protein